MKKFHIYWSKSKHRWMFFGHHDRVTISAEEYKTIQDFVKYLNTNSRPV